MTSVIQKASLTKDEVFDDFSYYLSPLDQRYMAAKAWFQYERSKKLFGAKYALDEYTRYHRESLWEKVFGK